VGSDIKWLQACRSYVMWLVLNWAGLRRAELAALATQDVDLEAGIIQVADGKGHQGRLVQIQPKLAPVLRWFLQEIRPQMEGRHDRVLFLSAYGRYFSPGALGHLLHVQQLAARLPVEDQFTAHASGEPTPPGSTKICAPSVCVIRSCSSSTSWGMSI
jgi:site-specific recombinase XerD